MVLKALSECFSKPRKTRGAFSNTLMLLCGQVLRSLAFLHSLGLIHCDLKPENILIKSYSRCAPPSWILTKEPTRISH